MLLASGLLLALLSAIFIQERSKEWRLRTEQMAYRLTLAREIVARDLDRVRADLHFVATLPEVLKASEGDDAALDAVTKVFEDFVTSQKNLLASPPD